MTTSDDPAFTLGTDFTACLLALANALVTKGLLSKHEIAQAAQERLLVLRRGLHPAHIAQLVTLEFFATGFETQPKDEWPPDLP